MNADNSIPGPVNVEQTPGPPGLLVLVAFVALLAGPWASAFLSALVLPADTAREVAAGLTLGVKVGVGLLAALDRRRGSSRPLLVAVLAFACAFLPLIVWVATYWAARELVRHRPLFHVAWGSTAALGLVLLVAFLLLTDTSGPSVPEPAPTVSLPDVSSLIINLPTATARPTRVVPTPTATKRPQPTPRPTATPECRSFATVSVREVGENRCVTGIVWAAYTNNEGVFIVEFSKASNALYLVSYDYYWEDAVKGVCVGAMGEIKRLGDNPVLVIQNLYYCD